MPACRIKVVLPILPKLGWHGTSLEEWKKGPDRSSTSKCLSFDEKVVKIGPVDAEIIGLWVIIKKKKKLYRYKTVNEVYV